MIRARSLILGTWLLALCIFLYSQSHFYPSVHKIHENCDNATDCQKPTTTTNEPADDPLPDVPSSPLKLEYPPGFERYDTADPDSNYHKDTYDRVDNDAMHLPSSSLTQAASKE